MSSLTVLKEGEEGGQQQIDQKDLLEKQKGQVTKNSRVQRLAVERGAGTRIGGKLRTGSAFQKTEEAEGRTKGRKEDHLMTGEEVPQEKEGLRCKSGHRKEPRA